MFEKESNSALAWFSPFIVLFVVLIGLQGLTWLWDGVSNSRRITSAEWVLVRSTCERNNWAHSEDILFRGDYCIDVVGQNDKGSVANGFDAKSVSTEADWNNWKRWAPPR